VVTAATTNDISIDDITLAQALVEIKTSKPKARCIIMQEPNETPTTTTIPISSKVQDKGKDVDYELATRLQKEEQGELTIEENSRLFVELMDKRKNHFAKLKAKEKGRKHLTKAQKRNQIGDRNSQMYSTFSKMLKNFDREDMEVLWRLVKDRFIKTKPVDDMDSFLIHTLKSMFEHHVEDTVWRNQQGLAKMYPLTNHTLHQMFNNVKLQVDEECEMAYELLTLVKK
nr:hypothetical protein [Tanacetum cinerariifolium]